MLPAKQLLRNAVERMPDNAAVEDVIERFYLLAKAEGLAAADRGDVISHEDVAREFLRG